MAGSKVRSLLLKMSRPKTLFFSCSLWLKMSLSSFKESVGVILSSATCICVKSGSYSLYCVFHFVFPCSRWVVAAARFSASVSVACLSYSLYRVLLARMRLLPLASWLASPKPSLLSMRMYFFSTRRTCVISTPLCISFVTICAREVPLAVSFCTNSATCESVMDVCDHKLNGNKLNSMMQTMFFFILVLIII